MNELWIQLGWCSRSDAWCFIRYDGSALIILFAIALLIDYARRRINKPDSKARKLESNPPLNLVDFGFAVKGWDDNTHTVNAYIDVSSPDISFKSAYPTITWTNEQGQELDSNNGR